MLAGAARASASDWDGLLEIHPVKVTPGPLVLRRGFQWRRFDTRRFTLYYRPAVHTEHVRQVAERVDNIWRFLKERSGVECRARIVVFMPATRSEYDGLMRPARSRWRSAQYPAAEDFAHLTVTAVETHDFVDRLASIMYGATHLFRHTRSEQMGQDNGPWCWWAGEFMARYFSMGLMRAFAVLRPRQELYAMWLRDQVVPRWTALETMSVSEAYPRRRGIKMRLVESILFFLEQRYGQEKMIRFWRAALDAKKERFPGSAAIFQYAFGKPLEELEKEWCDYYELGIAAWFLCKAQDAANRGRRGYARALTDAVIDSVPPRELRYDVWKRAWGQAGAFRLESGETDDAVECYETAAIFPFRWSLGPMLDPFGPQPPNRRGWALSLDVQAPLADERALSWIAAALFRKGGLPAAVEAYEQLARGFPNSPQAPQYFFTWGRLLLRQGRTQDAIQAWMKAARYPNSYHAARAQVYIGQQLARAGKTEEAKRRFLAALDTIVVGRYARYAGSLQKWARRELAKLGGAAPAPARRAPRAGFANVVTRRGEYAPPLARGLADAVAASPAQRSQIEFIFEKFRSRQLALWARLTWAGADRREWAAAQKLLLEQRQRELRALLDDAQQAQMDLWFIARLPDVPETTNPAPRDENAYADARETLKAWAAKRTRQRFENWADRVGLPSPARKKLAALLAAYRKDTRTLWLDASRGRSLAELARRQAQLDRRFDSQAARLLPPKQIVLFQRWRRAQLDQREQYNGVVRQAPPATQDDL